MTEPLSNRPKITQSDINAGQVTRYFAQDISTKRITEIDKVQYERLNGATQFLLLSIPWIITGFSNDTTSSDGKVIYGTRHKNSVTINFYNKTMPGLQRMLRNPLEYFQGVDNKSE